MDKDGMVYVRQCQKREAEIETLKNKPITEYPDVQRLIAKQVQLQAKYAAFKSSHTKLVEALRKYGKHQTCPILDEKMLGYHLCTCGLDQALAEAEKL